MNQDYGYPKTEFEFVRYLFDLGPESVLDLYEIEWPSDPHAQSETLMELICAAQDDELDWLVRKRAYDFLNNKARELAEQLYSEDGPPMGPIPPELFLWSVKVASGFAAEPKRGSGRSPFEKRMRNLKILMAVRMLRDKHGRSQEYSIGLIAEVTGVKEGTVKSGLATINEFFKKARTRDL